MMSHLTAALIGGSVIGFAIGVLVTCCGIWWLLMRGNDEDDETP